MKVDAASSSAGNPLSEHEDAITDLTEFLRMCFEHLPARGDFVLPPSSHARMTAIHLPFHLGAEGNDLDFRGEIFKLPRDVSTAPSCPGLPNDLEITFCHSRRSIPEESSAWDEIAADRLPLVVDWRLELVQVPVSDVDRAKTFYTEKAGFNADVDVTVSAEMRFVQLTPPGSPTSIAIGTGLSDTRPGSVQGMQLVVSDINAARTQLVERGVEVSEVQEFDWGSFVFFSDPDGNGWAVQQLPARG